MAFSITTGERMRLRHMARLNPSAKEAKNLSINDEVTFAPMDAIADGLGGLDTSLAKPFGELSAGSYSYFCNGDLLLAKVTPCFENGKKARAMGLTNGVGFATSEVHVIRPDRRKIDDRYLVYVLSSEDFRADGMRSMTGAGGLRRISDQAILNYRPFHLGSRLIECQSQNMTVAARATADRKVLAHLS